MDSPPKLAGETLIVHHIPLVHCQVPDRQYCPTSSRPHSYSKNDLGITRTTSLPERDLSQADSLVYSSLIQASEPTVKGKDSTKEEDWQGSITRKRHNPFLLNDEDENSTSSSSDREKSFHLHSTFGGPKSGFQFQDLSLPPFHLHDKPPIVKPWILASRSELVDGQEEKTSPDDFQKSSNGNPGPSTAIIEDQAWHHHGGPNFSLDWNQSSDLGNQDFLQSRECTCSGSEPLRHCRCYSASSQSEMDQQVSYVSDSSCNSSDGILVNFSTLYNKMNGHPRSNLNSGSLSCDSSFCSHPDTGAFYLDLQSSPTESKMSCDSHVQEASGKPCGCHHHSSSPVLDANCNSYHLNCDSVACNGESSDLTSCFQSQARLVVATQNYYKLVTCDLSSQSSPSPAGSSITSCSDDQTKGSPVQPTEYFLFQQPQTSSDTDDPKPLIERSKSDTIEGQVYVNVSPPNFNTGRQRSRSYDRSLDKTPSNRLGSLERMMSCPVKLSEGQAAHTQGSSPKRVTSFMELAKSRKKNGSSPPFRSSGDSSLEEEYHHDSSRTSNRGEFRSHSLPPMSFLHCMSRTCEGCTSDSVEPKAPNPNPTPNINQAYGTTGLGVDQALMCNLLDSAAPGLSFLQRDTRVKGDGMGAEAKPVFRYSKDQRPTTLPIQPFVFQHHFSKPKSRPLHSHFTSSLSQLYGLSSRSSSQHNASDSQSSAPVTLASQTEAGSSHAKVINVLGKLPLDGLTSIRDDQCVKPAPDTTRPSPLGSYSPIRSNATFFQSMDSGSSSSPSPEKARENQPPRSRSCPMSANLLPFRASMARGTTLPGAAKPTRKYEVSPKIEVQRPVVKREPLKEPSTQVSKHGLPPINSLPLLNTGLHDATQAGRSEEDKAKRAPENIMVSRPENIMVSRQVNANHLSPQALKWREYRRRNPLGLDRVHGLAGLSGSLDRRQETKIARRNHFFDFPSSINSNHLQSRLYGKPSAVSTSDFFPDYFSLTERPPAEFCLSPDGSAESVSIDLLQKRGLVKAVNIAVDLIVAHFGTSRDPGVKAKLGNSSVSPNIGHLILKYLCPAIRDILGDGLKPWVLDVIIGQRRNMPWTVVEASTQLGPSTKLLHFLCQKVNQYSELSSHSLRFNAFIFGLLNIRSVEFWFNHLYNHEDIIWAHYDMVGFLSVSHGVCQTLFEELLLLLQPLSLLPFDLDLLFEHHLVQMSREQQQQKEMLRVKQDLLQSVHSTIQLMRSREEEDQGSQEKKSCERSSLEASDLERPTGEGAAAVEIEEEQKKENTMEVKRDKQAGWWYQLMQSSQVYIENSSDRTRFMHQDRRRPGSGGTPRKAPPPREGVVEGAEACPSLEGMVERKPSKKETADNAQEERKSWMGSPPESVLNELKRGQEKENRGVQKAAQHGVHENTGKEATQSSPARKWGHLFGSRRPLGEGKQNIRPPSGWLSLDKSVFQMVAQTVSAGIWGDAAPEKEAAVTEEGGSPGSPCSQNPWPADPLRHRTEQKQQDYSFVYEPQSNHLRCGLVPRNGLMPLKFVPQPDRVDS